MLSISIYQRETDKSGVEERQINTLVRVFDVPEDEYLDEYFLTPISDAEVEMIMNEWNEWCVAYSKTNLDSFYKKYLHNRSIDRVLEKSCEKNKHRKRAIFTGNIGNGFIPVDFCVEWHD